MNDHLQNGRLSYSLLSSYPIGPFAVHSLTGHLRLTAPIDFETVKLYRVLVKATDGGVSESLKTSLERINYADNIYRCY